MMKVGGLTSTLEYHQPGICFQGQRPRPGCQGELQFPGEKEKFPVCPGKRGGWCWGVGSLWAPWSFG